MDKATRVSHTCQSTVTVTATADTSDKSASSTNLIGGAIATLGLSDFQEPVGRKVSLLRGVCESIGK